VDQMDGEDGSMELLQDDSCGCEEEEEWIEPPENVNLIPINLEIVFRIKKDSLWYDYKAGPYISSLSQGGGVSPMKPEKMKKIGEEIEKEKRLIIKQLIIFYNRRVETKTKIIDERIKQANLSDFVN